ncbi:MAG: FAD-binding oxidoreductase [Gammaproteobacteria bacterium]|nr:FAD-binding oxidoreductase [Gammaproteobacteria bacterium]
MVENNSSHKITVVGAGIVGLCCAWYLQRAGYLVTLIDRKEPGLEASFGNAGGLGIAEIVPLSSPGLIWKVPGGLMDPMGPLAVRWSYLPKITPWLMRFIRAGKRESMHNISNAMSALCQRTYDDFAPLLEIESLTRLMNYRVGALYLYDNESEYSEEQWKWRLRQELGVECERIDGGEISDLEPDIAKDFTYAMFVKHWSHLSDPYRFATVIADEITRHGGHIIKENVAALDLDADNRGRIILEQRGDYGSDSIVIAAGAWSHLLTKQINEDIPLETERGYHSTIAQPNVTLNRELIYAAQGFVITPMDMGMRISGTVELAGLTTAPDYRRARVLLPKAKRVLPTLNANDSSEWMGHRPALPDTLPVISRSTRANNVYYAFGHGHLGLTMAPTTGRLITDLINGNKPPIDLTPYRADRF